MQATVPPGLGLAKQANRGSSFSPLQNSTKKPQPRANLLARERSRRPSRGRRRRIRGVRRGRLRQPKPGLSRAPAEAPPHPEAVRRGRGRRLRRVRPADLQAGGSLVDGPVRLGRRHRRGRHGARPDGRASTTGSRRGRLPRCSRSGAGCATASSEVHDALSRRTWRRAPGAAHRDGLGTTRSTRGEALGLTFCEQPLTNWPACVSASPVKAGGRFSRNAATPSAKSCVRVITACVSASRRAAPRRSPSQRHREGASSPRPRAWAARRCCASSRARSASASSGHDLGDETPLERLGRRELAARREPSKARAWPSSRRASQSRRSRARGRCR